MSDETTPQDSAAMPPASAGSVAGGSLNAYLAWRDQTIASGDSDVNPFMVWSAGVRYATLTEAEREAVAYTLNRVAWPLDAAQLATAARSLGSVCEVPEHSVRATLRVLLERTK